MAAMFGGDQTLTRAIPMRQTVFVYVLSQEISDQMGTSKIVGAYSDIITAQQMAALVEKSGKRASIQRLELNARPPGIIKPA